MDNRERQRSAKCYKDSRIEGHASVKVYPFPAKAEGSKFLGQGQQQKKGGNNTLRQ